MISSAILLFFLSVASEPTAAFEIEDHYSFFSKAEQDYGNAEISHSGDVVIAEAYYPHTLYVWDHVRKKLLNEFSLGTEITNWALSPDGALVAMTNLNNIINVWDTHTGKSIAKLKVNQSEANLEIKISPDKEYSKRFYPWIHRIQVWVWN